LDYRRSNCKGAGEKMKKSDDYYRILLRKDKDASLIHWLEKDRRLGERPSKCVKRKLYALRDKENKSE